MLVKDLNTVVTNGSGHAQSVSTSNTKNSSDEDQQLENAASIGTSLMLVNSHRALFIMYVHLLADKKLVNLTSGFLANSCPLLVLIE
jgi:hypothetical protein